jgi:hypothetical protein
MAINLSSVLLRITEEGKKVKIITGLLQKVFECLQKAGRMKHLH